MKELRISDLDFGNNENGEYIFLNKEIDFGDKIAVRGQVVYVKSYDGEDDMYLIEGENIKKLISQFYRKLKIERLI